MSIFSGNLFQIALAPAAIGLVYTYIRDKYEKEPVRLLLIGVLYGAYSTSIISAIGRVFKEYITVTGPVLEPLYISFVTSAGIEEGVKYMILYFLVWRNKNFNERFDGIVYAVFVSLGFATVENIIYVFSPLLGGYYTAFSRAVFSVPGHGFFGVSMGYYLALAKFEPHNKPKHMIQAFIVPWLLHGTYNYILYMNLKYYMLLFVPFVMYLWVSGFKKMRAHLESSPFK